MLCNCFVSENYLSAKITSYDIEKNGYSSCCIVGGHLGFFPETTCNIKVRGYYCIVLDLFVLKTYIYPPKTTFRKTSWYFLYYWRPTWIFCVIFDQVLEHEIPQNKNVILNTKVKFVCPLCTQT